MDEQGQLAVFLLDLTLGKRSSETKSLDHNHPSTAQLGVIDTTVRVFRQGIHPTNQSTQTAQQRFIHLLFTRSSKQVRQNQDRSHAVRIAEGMKFRERSANCAKGCETCRKGAKILR